MTGKDTYNIKRFKNKDCNSLTDYTDFRKKLLGKTLIIFKRKDSVYLLMYLISFSFLRYSHCPCTVLPSMLRVGSMLVLPSRKNRSGRTETFCLRMTYSYPPVLFCFYRKIYIKDFIDRQIKFKCISCSIQSFW